ncbi:3-phosphoshikimate 1-carboxyvinyltransferase [Microlunatus panaciterrae]|uniref:3-phosphoshikimate 1-carboxyvinyltransferase n=1 Tax=Microlunatus panaciterrae TaxID=400768 RepID=A0ABS2RFC1_9ACTN|nr:3-phosphoshikimate 1-carboxyvinyltransferase [Microlunatus panaciterrae]
MSTPQQQPWPAPIAQAPVEATVLIPGSKSETNRALVLAALATGPSVITDGLDSRDTRLMRDALRALGVGITEAGNQWTVQPPSTLSAGGTVDCGLAGTVMRFVPPIAALVNGSVSFDGDEQAYARPMDVMLAALDQLGVTVEDQATSLPFTLTGTGRPAGGVVTIDASSSSQFVSGLLLAGAKYAEGIDIRHDGEPIPSLPHIEMTVAMLRARGVQVDDSEPDRWVVAPGPIRPLDVSIEPDLSNAAPFLAAAAVTGGTVTIPHWPTRTLQPGDHLRGILEQFGAEVRLTEAGLTVHGTDQLHHVDLDLREASELTPVVAAVAALANTTSHIRGVGHIRGHETDRLAALEFELNSLGGHVVQTDDGLTIHPRLMYSGEWRTYADHRLAQAGAVLGLVIDDIVLDDVSCVDKTMPEFVTLWQQMLAGSERRSGVAEARE